MIMREETHLDPVDTWFASALAPDRREETVAAMAPTGQPDQPDLQQCAPRTDKAEVYPRSMRMRCYYRVHAEDGGSSARRPHPRRRGQHRAYPPDRRTNVGPA